MSECELKTLACRGLRVGPSKVGPDWVRLGWGFPLEWSRAVLLSGLDSSSGPGSGHNDTLQSCTVPVSVPKHGSSSSRSAFGLSVSLNRDWCDYSCDTGVVLSEDSLVQGKKAAIGPFWEGV